MLKIVKTENGLVRGFPGNNTRISVFKGIPFAQPPIGENRWRAPQPCKDWEGIKDCYKFGPIPYQDQPAIGTDVYCKEWHVDPDVPFFAVNIGADVYCKEWHVDPDIEREKR